MKDLSYLKIRNLQIYPINISDDEKYMLLIALSYKKMVKITYIWQDVTQWNKQKVKTVILHLSAGETNTNDQEISDVLWNFLSVFTEEEDREKNTSIYQNLQKKYQTISV